MATKQKSINYDFDRLIGFDIVDIYSALARPKEFAAFQEEMRNVMPSILAEEYKRKGWSYEPTLEQIDTRWEEIYIEHAKTFDLEILNQFGLSVDEFIKFVMNKRKQRLAGRGVRPETPRQKVIAAYAFHEAYKNKQTRAEAIKQAGDWIAEDEFNTIPKKIKQPSIVTLEKWLKEINLFYPSLLPAAKRGRKKLK